MSRTCPVDGEGRMADGNARVVGLAQRLRDLRENTWPDVTLTQETLPRR